MTTLPRSGAPCLEPSTAAYTQIPRALIRMCTPREYQLISALLGYRWFEDSPIIPSVKTLADEMGCSTRTVQYAMRGLVDKGLIVVEGRKRPDGGPMSNRYHPGLMLIPLLAPLPPRDSTSSGDRLRGVVQPVAAERYQRKDSKGSSKTKGLHSQPIQAGECSGCGGPHTTRDCPKYGRLIRS